MAVMEVLLDAPSQFCSFTSLGSEVLCPLLVPYFGLKDTFLGLEVAVGRFPLITPFSLRCMMILISKPILFLCPLQHLGKVSDLLSLISLLHA